MQLSSDLSPPLQQSWITSFWPVRHSLMKFLLWKSQRWITARIRTKGRYVQIKVVWITDFIQGYCNKREGSELSSTGLEGRGFLRLEWEGERYWRTLALGKGGWPIGMSYILTYFEFANAFLYLSPQLRFKKRCSQVSEKEKKKKGNTYANNTNKNYILFPFIPMLGSLSPAQLLAPEPGRW